MIPSHHPPEEWLLAHVAGSLGESMDLLVATHATLCPVCRERIEILEEAAGAALSELPDAPFDGLDALLSNLPQQDPAPAPPDTAHNLPAPLLAYVGTRALPWKFLAPGIQQIVLPIQHGNMPVRLVKLAPGTTIPTHRHAGLERTLVLSGGYDDHSGTYVRGDLGVLDHMEVHDQRIHLGEPCVSLLVADEPLIPVGLKATLLSWFVKA